VVSGDNKGHLQVWDGETGVMTMSFHQHTATINALAASPDGSRVFASGSDSRTICIARVTGADSEPDRWVFTSGQRPHTHDVTALAVLSTPSGPYLFSGGLDAKICSFHADARFDSTKPAWIVACPPVGTVTAGDEAGVFIVQHRNYVDVWKTTAADIRSTPFKATRQKRKLITSEVATELSSDPIRCVCRVALKGVHHISAAVVAPDGSVVIISSKDGTRLFSLSGKDNEEGKDEGSNPHAVRSHSPLLASMHCKKIVFSPDSRAVALASSSGEILVGTLNLSRSSQESFEITHRIDHRSSVPVNDSTSLSDLDSCIRDLCFSYDSRWLSISSCGNRGRVSLFSLDESRYDWELPPFEAPIACSKFSPTGVFFVVLLDNTMYLFDVALRELILLSSTFAEKLASSLKDVCHPLECISFPSTEDGNNTGICFCVHGQSTVLVGHFGGEKDSVTVSKKYRSIAHVSLSSMYEMVCILLNLILYATLGAH